MLKARTLLAIAAVLGLASHALGAIMTDPTLAVGDSNYLGRIVPGVPANEVDEAGYINALNDLLAGAGPVDYAADPDNDLDRIGSSLLGPFPDITDPTDSDKVQIGDSGPFTIDTGDEVWFYVLGKYDGNKGGAYVWYFEEGVTGEITLPGTVPQNNDPSKTVGLSHISVYGAEVQSTPEPASVAIWGVLGVVGLAAARIRRRR
jgi:MYXO-CTERM domain-containing protein